MGEYFPSRFTGLDDADSLRKYSEEEFIAIARAMSDWTMIQMSPIGAPPAGAGEGDIVYSDGSSPPFNSGEGLYVNINGIWVPIATIPTGNALFHVNPITGLITNPGTAAAPVKYIQDALDLVANSDLGSFGATIQLDVPDVDYLPRPVNPVSTSVAFCKYYKGTGPVTIQGDATGSITEANRYRLITVGGASPAPTLANNSGRPFQVTGVRIQSANFGEDAIAVSFGGSLVNYSNIVFGTSFHHISCTYGGQAHNTNQAGQIIRITGAYQIHWYVDSNGLINDASGTPARETNFVAATQNQAFAWAVQGGGMILGATHNFTGARPATGENFHLESQGFIASAGQNRATYLPGNGTFTEVTGGSWS